MPITSTLSLGKVAGPIKDQHHYVSPRPHWREEAQSQKGFTVDLNDMKTLPDISGTYCDPLTPLDHAIEITRKYLAGSGALAARKYLEMRRDLPYRILPASNGRQIIVNREYKPLGWPDKSKFARYEECPSQHVDLSDEAIDQFRHPKRGDALFGDECAPWFSRSDGRQYLPRLLALRDQVALAVAARRHSQAICALC